MIALVSISVALINLLPVPVLDGGHLLVFAVEAVRGRPLSVRARGIYFIMLTFAFSQMLFYLAIGQQTPPVASVLMLTCSIAKESVWDVTRANLPFIGVLLFTLALITYVPVTTLGLVNMFYR